MAAKVIILCKSHIKGHTRNVGGRAIFIKEHDDKRTKGAGGGGGGGGGKGGKDAHAVMQQAKIDFTDKVYQALEELGEMDRSDAQAVADLQEDLIDFGFEDGQTPKGVAQNILGAAEKSADETKKRMAAKTSATGYGGGDGKEGEPKYHKDKAQEFRSQAESHGKFGRSGDLVKVNNAAAEAHDKAAETSHPDHVKAAGEAGKRASEANKAAHKD